MAAMALPLSLVPPLLLLLSAFRPLAALALTPTLSDWDVTARVVALHAGNPGHADVQLQWSAFDHDHNSAGPVVAYDVQSTVSGRGAWVSLATSVSGRSVVETFAVRHEKQRIFTRVDDGETIADGAFRLALSHASTSPLDMHQHTVTPPIAFDASDLDVKRALETLDVVVRVQVFRTVLDATAGTIEWVVLFDEITDDHADLPLLALYSETLSARYSGAGDPIAIQSMRDGTDDDHALVCERDCVFSVADVRAGQTLAFRVRAQTTMGWSDWSRASAPLEIPATPLPHAPSSPELLAAATTRLTVQWTSEANTAAPGPGLGFFPMTSFHLQQQCDGDVSWRSVDTAIVPGRVGGRTVATSTPTLRPNTSCAFRVAAANANGVGPFSLPSARFATAAARPSAPQGPLVVARANTSAPSLRLTWQPPASDGGARVTDYELEVRAIASSTWLRVPAAAIDVATRSCLLSSADSYASSLSLLPFTRYVARIRARNTVGASAFVSFPDFLTDFRAVEADTTTRTTATTTTTTTTQGATFAAATRDRAAKDDDLQYVHGVANGAIVPGQNGEPGAVLVVPITFDGTRLDEQAFFFTGTRAQTLPIAAATALSQQIVALDVLAWGGGGGRGDNSAGGAGGGGAFARGVVRVAVGETIELRVGGGGEGAIQGGRGGWNGGGDGGNGRFRGGGGGGASEVRINGVTVLVAGGGGGGGASDYCCAHGGGGGGGSGTATAEDGLAPDASTIPLDARVTGRTRNEYHSIHIDGDLRDVVGLPARHAHLDYGAAAASADYTTLATGGRGASSSHAGTAGIPASYVVSRVGKCFVDAGSGALAVGAALAASQATPGRRGRGGTGQDGQDAGGGGGGGYFGGGGGGAGIDGAGGGGGSSFVALDALFTATAPAFDRSERVATFTARATTSTSIVLTWTPPPFGFALPVEGFVVELANRSASEHFRVHRVLPATATTVTVGSLRPRWWYRVRVKPLFRDAAHGRYSDIRVVQTLATPLNTWHRVHGVRATDDRTIHAGSRGLDALPARGVPSARRGHSLTAFDDGFLYLFGGFSSGYACNAAHKAPCVVATGVNNELWRFDTRLRSWLELPTTGTAPPPREKHTMAVVSNHLLLFGGRQGGIDNAAALNDLWRLTISSTTRKTTTATLQNREATLAIRDGAETLTVANVGHAPDMCVADMVVTLDVTHACAQTLRFELLGPGPSTHPQRQHTATSPLNAQTVESTWSDVAGFDTGQQRVTPPTASARAFPVTLQRPEMASSGSTACLSGRRTLTFGSSSSSSSSTTTQVSLESLAVFRQFSAAGGWTLSVLDTALDGKTGTLHSWDVQFTLVPCVPSWTWTNVGVVATGTAPSPRFQHSTIVYQTSMFVFGGRSTTSAKPLTDLYRFDYNAAASTGVWTALLPVTTYRDKPFYHGRVLLVTPYELLAIGQGIRTRATSVEPHALTSATYVSRKSVTEPLGVWQQLPVAVRATDEDNEVASPLGRYWSSAVFTSEPTPKVYLYGGQDDTSFLSDLWELRLDALVESDATTNFEAQQLETCAWRMANTVFQQKWTASCGASAASVAAATATECSLDTLLLYAWCAKMYQSVQL